MSARLQRFPRAVSIATAMLIVCGGLAAIGPVAQGSVHKPSVWRAEPDPAAEGVELSAVDADSPHDAWAVGQQFSVKHPHRWPRAAVEHWNGQKWRPAPAPTNAVELSSVSARSARDVWATGVRNYSNSSTTIWHFDGKKWKRIRSNGLPHLNTGSVLAVGSHLWLFGSVDTGRPDGGAVIANYQPATHRWTVLRANRGGALYEATAVSATSIWAVGSTSQFAGDGHPLVAHWDGSTWTSQTFPDVNGQLAAVAAHSDTDVMAVGSVLVGHDISSRTFTMKRDGAEWTPTTGSPYGGYSYTAVSAGPGTEYWGAGDGSSGGAPYHELYRDGAWHTVRGAEGSFEVASGRAYRSPLAIALARVPGSDTTLSVGYATRAGAKHFPTPAPVLEATDE